MVLSPEAMRCRVRRVVAWSCTRRTMPGDPARLPGWHRLSSITQFSRPPMAGEASRANACGESLDGGRLERAKGFEPSTPTLARLIPPFVQACSGLQLAQIER